MLQIECASSCSRSCLLPSNGTGWKHVDRNLKRDGISCTHCVDQASKQKDCCETQSPKEPGPYLLETKGKVTEIAGWTFDQHRRTLCVPRLVGYSRFAWELHLGYEQVFHSFCNPHWYTSSIVVDTTEWLWPHGRFRDGRGSRYEGELSVTSGRSRKHTCRRSSSICPNLEIRGRGGQESICSCLKAGCQRCPSFSNPVKIGNISFTFGWTSPQRRSKASNKTWHRSKASRVSPATDIRSATKSLQEHDPSALPAAVVGK